MICNDAKIHVDGEWVHIHTTFSDIDELPKMRGVVRMYAQNTNYAFYTMNYRLTDKITLYVR